MSRYAAVLSGSRRRRILHATDVDGPRVALRGGRVEHVLMADVLGKPRRVDPHGERVMAARGIGTIFGDGVRS